ncbi:MAG: hypothetical protein ACYC6Z_08210 [Thermoleophilia bacterium]
MLAAVFLASCGGDQASTDQAVTAVRTSAHEVPPEVDAKILADVTQDLQIISNAGADTAPLADAMTGKALSETKATIGKDLSQGKYRKRDYQNIKVRTSSYSLPVVEVAAEFDDNGYYVDANTGEALDQPTNEHKSYALAAVEEGGRWKISLILSPSATSTTGNSSQTNQ